MSNAQTRRGHEPWIGFLIPSGVALTAGWQLRAYALWSPHDIASHGLFLDDAWFYSVLAENFREHGFLTFDGVMSTNGVQPLWILVQLLLKTLFPLRTALCSSPFRPGSVTSHSRSFWSGF